MCYFFYPQPAKVKIAWWLDIIKTFVHFFKVQAEQRPIFESDINPDLDIESTFGSLLWLIEILTNQKPRDIWHNQ